MARRNYRKSSKKIQPAVQTLSFGFTAQSKDKEFNYIDLSQCVSLVNRRFYRQGLNWAVSNIKVLSGSGVVGQVSIHKLPNTWVMSNAWEKSFRAWTHMIKNATEEQSLESIKGKFLDFKIYANEGHHKAGYPSNLLPFSAATATTAVDLAALGQWQPAEIELPSTTATPGQSFAYELIGVGGNTAAPGDSGLNAKGIIAGYEVSRALPSQQDPNVPDDASSTDANWILGLYNDGTNQDGDVVQMLEITGDNPPYPFENDKLGNTDTMYPGGQNNLSTLEIHSFEFITGTTVGGTTRIKGGNFPCGLIEVATLLAEGDVIRLEIDLVPGMHRGYLAEPMTDM